MNWPAVADALGYPSAGLAILVESSGVPFPGEAFLLFVAAWATTRHQPLAVAILVGFTCATAGADLAYWIGHRGGRPFVERFGTLFHIRPDHLARAELFYARHGDSAVLATRFLLGMRTWGSMLAGMARMPFWKFQLYSAIGGLAWATVIVVAGYLLGSNLALLQTIARDIGLGGLVILFLIVLVLLVARERAARPR